MTAPIQRTGPKFQPPPMTAASNAATSELQPATRMAVHRRTDSTLLHRRR
ncbi:hypothetical protein QCD71_23510 [Sphingomonas sp. PsM26]|nr:hypothetical protein [Sphingomonas sp. PsM26]